MLQWPEKSKGILSIVTLCMSILQKSLMGKPRIPKDDKEKQSKWVGGRTRKVQRHDPIKSPQAVEKILGSELSLYPYSKNWLNLWPKDLS